jgi:DNA-binding PadR family transcriptional regulator
MRRKLGTLIPIEMSIVGAGIDLARRGVAEFYGYSVAKEIRESEEARRLTAHGTLYRALERLEAGGFLESRLEDAEAAAAENRPRRRLYRMTAVGEKAYSAARDPDPSASHRPLRRRTGLT